MNPHNPFTPGCATAKVFDLCAKGTTRDEVKAFCEKNDVGAPRMFYCMRLNEYPINGNPRTTWKYTEVKGTIKLESIKGVTSNGGYVLLDPEVKKVFRDDKAVNDALRLVIALQKCGGNRRARATRP